MNLELFETFCRSQGTESQAECDSDVYFFDNAHETSLMMDAGDGIFRSFSQNNTSPSYDSDIESCFHFDTKKDNWSLLFDFGKGFACAISFAAGLSLGVMLGACGWLSPQRS